MDANDARGESDDEPPRSGRPARRRRALWLAASTSLALGPATHGSAQDPPTLTLERAVALAEANHPRLERDRAALETAQARARMAWSAHWPGIVAELAYKPQTPNFVPSPAFRRVLRRREETGSARVADTAGGVVTVPCAPEGNPSCDRAGISEIPATDYKLYGYWTAEVGLAWTLFDWGKTTNASRAAKTMVEARQMGLAATRAQVRLDTQVAFYDVLAAEAATQVAQEEIAARTRHLESARAMNAAGRQTRVDVVSAEASLASAKLLHVRARAAEDAARAMLATALGEYPPRAYRLVAPELASEAPLPNAAELADRAAVRPEVQELALEARSAAQAARSARGALLPQLDLRVGPWWAGSAPDDLVLNYGAFVSVTYPGNKGMNPWYVLGQRAEAAAYGRSLSAQSKVLRNLVRQEAEQARVELEANRAALREIADLVRAARERHERAEVRYREGVGSLLDLSDAALEYTNARFEEVRTYYRIGRARSQLEYALGRALGRAR